MECYIPFPESLFEIKREYKDRFVLFLSLLSFLIYENREAYLYTNK